MCPADGNFTAAIAKGNPKAGEVQGQTRQHSRLINLLGVKQIVVGINKMDCDVAKYGKARYDECAQEAKFMLGKVGWKKDFVEKSIPILPISGWMGDNLITKSKNMDWWTGMDIVLPNKETLHVDCLLDCLDKMVVVPERDEAKPMRTPISGVYKIKGVGDVLTGRVEQGIVTPGDEVVFLPTHTASTACGGKVFTVEMHHKSVEKATAGDNVGLNIKGLPKDNMPRVGDVMIKKTDNSIGITKSFTAQVQVMNHPGELKVGYTPIAFVRTGRSAVKLTEIQWKIGKDTQGQKAEQPANLKATDMAQVVFAPTQAFVVDTFKNCEGLGRIAIMEGNSVVMLGKVIKAERA
jgi:elongation factor 1-alpha